MNAVIALCHFCELHGPQIILVTQPYHLGGRNPLDFIEEEAGAPYDAIDVEYALTVSYRAIVGDEDYDDLLTGGHAHGPHAEPSEERPFMGSTSTPGKETLKAPPRSPPPRNRQHQQRKHEETAASEEKRCAACGWGCKQSGFVTHDESSATLYATRHRPQRPEVYQVLRRACIRALSGEVGTRGPVIFGDSTNGFVFSYTFNILDGNARGGKRQYGFLLLMSDQLHLVSAWPFLTQHFSTVIRDLQDRTSKTSTGSSAHHHPSFRRNLSFDRFRSMRHVRDMTSLPDHIKEPLLYSQLHSYGTWLLKGLATRLMERPVEGPSLIGVTHEPETTYPAMTYSDLFASLGINNFVTLLHNITIGNQCIIMCNRMDIGDDIARLLGLVLPRRCLSLMLRQNAYHPPYACNILSMHADVPLPDALDRNLAVILRVHFDEMAEKRLTDKHLADMEEDAKPKTLLDQIGNVDDFFEQAISEAKRGESAQEENHSLQQQGTIDNSSQNMQRPQTSSTPKRRHRGGHTRCKSDTFVPAFFSSADSVRSLLSHASLDEQAVASAGKTRSRVEGFGPSLSQVDSSSRDSPRTSESVTASQTDSDATHAPNSSSSIMPRGGIPIARRRSRRSGGFTAPSLNVNGVNLDDQPAAEHELGHREPALHQQPLDMNALIKGLARHANEPDSADSALRYSLPPFATPPRRQGTPRSRPSLQAMSAPHSPARTPSRATTPIRAAQKQKQQQQPFGGDFLLSTGPLPPLSRGSSVDGLSSVGGDHGLDISNCTDFFSSASMNAFYHPAACEMTLEAASQYGPSQVNLYTQELLKATARNQSVDLTLQWILTLREKFTQLSKTYFALTRAHSRTPSEAIFMVGLDERDNGLLMFFTGALSKPHRVKLLKTREETMY